MFCNDENTFAPWDAFRPDFRSKYKAAVEMSLGTRLSASMTILIAVKQVAANPGFAHALDQFDSSTPAVKVPLVVGLRILVRLRRIASEIG